MKTKTTHIAAALTTIIAAVLAPLSAAAAGTGAVADAHGASALQGKLEALALRARPGMLGIAVVDLQDGSEWQVDAERAYPMMSVFKAPTAAAVLQRIDRGELSFDQTVTLTRADLGWGTIRDHFHGDRMTFTVRQLLTDAVSNSDNTAVDALVKLVGGAGAVTNFLRAHGIHGMRVDQDEAGIGRTFAHLDHGDGPPVDETPEEEELRLQRGYKAYLADPRDRSTPDAAALFLRKLWRKELLSPWSTRYLIDLMRAQTAPRRLRAGLPAGVDLADKCGTSYTLDGLTAAYNDIGILSWPDGDAVIVAAFLTASPASKTDRDAIFAELGRDVAESLHP